VTGCGHILRRPRHVRPRGRRPRRSTARPRRPDRPRDGSSMLNPEIEPRFRRVAKVDAHRHAVSEAGEPVEGVWRQDRRIARLRRVESTEHEGSLDAAHRGGSTSGGVREDDAERDGVAGRASRDARGPAPHLLVRGAGNRHTERRLAVPRRGAEETRRGRSRLPSGPGSVTTTHTRAERGRAGHGLRAAWGDDGLPRSGPPCGLHVSGRTAGAAPRAAACRRAGRREG